MITKFELYEAFWDKKRVYDDELKELVKNIKDTFDMKNLARKHSYRWWEGKLKNPDKFEWKYLYNDNTIQINKESYGYSLHLKKNKETWSTYIASDDYSKKIIEDLANFFIKKEREIEEAKRADEIKSKKGLIQDINISGFKKDAEKYNL